MATGENAGTWGQITNTNLYLLQQDVDLNTDIDLDRNQTQGNKHKETLVNFLRGQIIENPNLIDKLTNTYQEDYTLWNATILPANS
jgi:hypothetical protein